MSCWPAFPGTMSRWWHSKAGGCKGHCHSQLQNTDHIGIFSQNAYIPEEQERYFHVGYLFLQQLCTELQLDNICRKIRDCHKFSYDVYTILTDLVYARILSSFSKLSSYSCYKSLLEHPKYTLQNLYRSLSAMAEEFDFI